LSLNPFLATAYYRQLILDQVRLTPRHEFHGKSFICLSLTRYCSVGCRFCFFKSPRAYRKVVPDDAFGDEGVDRLVQFIRDADVGYLLISGGGDPLDERRSALRLISEAMADSIVIVTSGNWARSLPSARRYLKAMHSSFLARRSPTHLTIRLSVDEFHGEALGLAPAHNLLRLFREQYRNEPNFCFKIHTLCNDPCIAKFLEEAGLRRAGNVQIAGVGDECRTSVKISPRQEHYVDDTGFHLSINYAKLFHSDENVDLRDRNSVERNLAIFQKDLEESENGNSSRVNNLDGSLGLDFWITYDGRVTTWGNQLPDNRFNVYHDRHRDVVRRSFNDPASLAFIEWGGAYRDAILGEVNPRAVLLAKAVNIRDFVGDILFEDARDRLYFSLRALQDFRRSGHVSDGAMAKWPEELQKLVQLGKKELRRLYRTSRNDIVRQVLAGAATKEDLQRLRRRIDLGHFSVSKESCFRLEMALKNLR
jgi:hypothetical protein